MKLLRPDISVLVFEFNHVPKPAPKPKVSNSSGICSGILWYQAAAQPQKGASSQSTKSKKLSLKDFHEIACLQVMLCGPFCVEAGTSTGMRTVAGTAATMTSGTPKSHKSGLLAAGNSQTLMTVLRQLDPKSLILHLLPLPTRGALQTGRQEQQHQLLESAKLLCQQASKLRERRFGKIKLSGTKLSVMRARARSRDSRLRMSG